MQAVGSYRWDAVGLTKRGHRVGEWRMLSHVDVVVRGGGGAPRYFAGFVFREGGAEWFAVPTNWWGAQRLRELAGLLRTAVERAGPEVTVTPRARAVLEWGGRDALEVAQLRATNVGVADAGRLLAAAKWRWMRLEHRVAAKLARAAAERNAQEVDAWRTWLAIEAERGAAVELLRRLSAEVVARAPDDVLAKNIARESGADSHRQGGRAFAVGAVVALWLSLAALVGWGAYERGKTEKMPRQTRVRFDLIEHYKQSAEKGDTSAMLKLADSYQWGFEVPKDPAQAFAWRMRAAEAGNIEAMEGVGRALRNGEGVQKDITAAVRWLTKAAEAGSGRAANTLGDVYYYGRDTAKDHEASFRWYKQAHELGYKGARSQLGYHYERGLGTPQSWAAALPLYRELAEEGNAWAANKLGVMHARGDGVARDPVEAVRWYRLAAEKGNAVAQSNLGLALLAGRGVARDPAEAATWFEKAAAQKNATAMRNLGNLLLRGEGVPRDDARGASLITAAAETDMSAKVAHARLLWRGTGMSADREAATRLLDGLIAEGSASARSTLAKLLLEEGTPEGMARARELFAAGAEKGSIYDLAHHGVMSLEGIGGAQDGEVAIAHLRKAEAAGHDFAAIMLAGASMGYRRGEAERQPEDARRLLQKVSGANRAIAMQLLQRLDAGGDIAAVLAGKESLSGEKETARQNAPADTTPLPEERLPMPTYQVRPEYPLSLRFLGVSGEVVVDFIITPEGTVDRAYALRSTLAAFDDAAVAAVRRWRFQPGVKDGKRVPTHMRVPIVFQMDEEPVAPAREGAGATRN